MAQRASVPLSSLIQKPTIPYGGVMTYDFKTREYVLCESEHLDDKVLSVEDYNKIVDEIGKALSWTIDNNNIEENGTMLDKARKMTQDLIEESVFVDYEPVETKHFPVKVANGLVKLHIATLYSSDYKMSKITRFVVDELIERGHMYLVEAIQGYFTNLPVDALTPIDIKAINLAVKFLDYSYNEYKLHLKDDMPMAEEE
jgi:hypothetical protein